MIKAKPSHREFQRDGSCLAYAVALQDHFSRTLQIGGTTRLPSQLPGSPLTLAQRVGLIPKPDKLLTQEEWSQIHGLARQRRDPFTACAICLETFKAEQQVLLSCSHVFHAQCLTSFESHVRLKACPLCRKQSYQKHLISDAAEAFRHVCATRIQAAVRGWLCRKGLALTLSAAPDSRSLKRTWISARLQETRQALTGLVQSATDDLNALFAEIDASLEVSRQLGDPRPVRQAAVAAHLASPHSAVPGRPDAQHQQEQRQSPEHMCLQQTQSGGQRSGQHSSSTAAAAAHRRSIGSSSSQPGNTVLANISGSERSNGDNANSNNITPMGRPSHQQANTPQTRAAIARAEQQQLQMSQVSSIAPAAKAGESSRSVSSCTSTVDWEQVVSKACERGETECAICLGPLQAQRQTQGVALLSCSHVFHMSCVTSFEQFEQGRGGQASCPVCRSAYSRRCFDVCDMQ